MALPNADMEAIDDLNGQFDGEGNNGTQAFDENFEFDSSDATEDSLNQGEVEKEGFYHFEIAKVDFHLQTLDSEGKPNTPHIVITCKTLAEYKGSSPIGSILWHRIYVGQKGTTDAAKQGSVDSMYNFGLGCGLYKWGKIKTDKGEKTVVTMAETGLPKISVAAWAKAVGMQFCAKVTKTADRVVGDKTYKGRIEIPFGRTYRPDNANVSHVVKNLEALAAIGIVLPAASSANTTAEKKGSESVKTAATSPAVKTASAATVATTAAVIAPAAEKDEFDMGDF